jgi:hypothetical protein
MKTITDTKTGKASNQKTKLMNNSNNALKGIFNILASLVLLSGISSFTNLNDSLNTLKDRTKIENKASKINSGEKESFIITLPAKKTIRKGDQEIQKNMQHLIHDYMNPVLAMPNMLLSDAVVTNNFYNDYMLYFNPTTALDADTEIELQFQMEQMANQQKDLLLLSDTIMNDDFYSNQYIYADQSSYLVSDCIINRNFVTEIAE